MLQQLFGTELAFPIRVAIALAVIAALLGVTVLLMRRMGTRGSAGAGRNRGGPRLAVVDSVHVDQRRKLVLVRRDEVEHLLLIGGNADIVVEPQIGVRPAEAQPAAGPALAATPISTAALTPAREAQALARPALRRGIAAEAPAAPLPPPAVAPQPAPAAEAAPVAATAPAEAAPREERRSLLGRRPLPRGDGTLSGQGTPARPAARPAASEAAAAVTRETTAPALAREPAATRETEPARLSAAVEPPAAPKVETPAPAPRVEAPAARQEPEAASAAPQLSLSDLLGDDEPAAEAPAAPSPAAPAASAERPAEPVAERALSRFALQARPRPAEARPALEGRPRLDPVPRLERPSEDPLRPVSRGEPSLRPREFAFRPKDVSRDSPLEPARREPAPLRDVSRDLPPRAPERIIRPTETKAPEAIEPPAIEAPEAIRAETQRHDIVRAEPSRAEPHAPTVHGEASAGAAPEATPAPAAHDPLDDFDAALANLLGRGSAQGR